MMVRMSTDERKARRNAAAAARYRARKRGEDVPLLPSGRPVLPFDPDPDRALTGREAAARHRARKRGEAMPQRPNNWPGRQGTVEERFWRKVQKSDGCWLWIGATIRGYGELSVDGRPVYAHRLSLEWALGRPISPGMDACHTCDEALCVRPEHLYEGTRKQNVADMMARGRHWSQKP